MVNLKIAIQKSGRLRDDSLTLLKECGIFVDNDRDQLMAEASNFNMEVLYLRNSDIPQYVRDGVVDIAIIGSNTMVEKNMGIIEVLKLGFSRCRLSIAVPKNVEFSGIEWLKGKRIATSYPNSLKEFLISHDISGEIHEISGSVEIAPNIGLADAICDIVSSGSTLFKNGLQEVYKIFESEALLATNPNLSPEKEKLLEKLVFRIKSVLASQNNKYILLNAPKKSLDRICALIPGMKSPTVLPLTDPEWVSIHSVVRENDFWEVVDALKKAGAQGILIIPIEKMIM